MDGGDGGVTQANEGEFAGWKMFANENFEEAAGPFYWRQDADGRVRCAFRAEAKHTNAGGRLHGGSLMTLADMALFAVGGASWKARAASPSRWRASSSTRAGRAS